MNRSEAVNPISAVSSRFARIAAVASAAAALLFAATPPQALAQSQSGFTYNGMDYIDYSQSDYLNSTEAAQTIRATNANYTAVMATWYVANCTSNTIAAGSTSPSDNAVVAAIQALQAEGITVSLKPHVDPAATVNGCSWRGNFTWPSTDTTTAEQEAWLTGWFTRLRIVHPPLCPDRDREQRRHHGDWNRVRGVDRKQMPQYFNFNTK
jgi:hypothetical protein